MSAAATDPRPPSARGRQSDNPLATPPALVLQVLHKIGPRDAALAGTWVAPVAGGVEARRRTVRHWPAAIALMALLPAAPTHAQLVGDMSPDRVRAALAWGLRAPETELDPCARRTDRTWRVHVDTPCPA